MLMGIIGWVIVGLIAGFAASKFVNLRGDDPNIGIGLGGVGAVVGGALYSVISGAGVTAFNIWSLLFACIGAAAAVGTWHAMRRRSAPRTW
jgi:uncharacterized membrane protein YeaQ/YmgE (transglycosylase-associated protein family)